MTAIYRIRNIVNGHFYVGSSVRVRVRFQTHRRQLRKGTHHCSPLQRAWVKYGEEAFKFEVVEDVPSKDVLLAAEGRWLKEHFGKAHCYNVGSTPEAPWLGLKHAQAAKDKVSQAHKGKQHRLGHSNSPEHRQRISAAMKGKVKSPEHVEKIRQRMFGTTYAKGRRITEEQLTGCGIVETTQNLEFISIAAAAAHFGLERPNLIRVLRSGGLLKRGLRKGLHFQRLPKTAE